MTFTESNTVEAYIRDRLSGPERKTSTDNLRYPGASYGASGLGWHYTSPSDLPRQPQDVLVESWVREALIRLNPEIAARPDRAEDVLYRLRAIIMGVRSDGLVKANEEFAAWLTGERSMPFGKNGEHITIRLLDFADPVRNEYVVTTQYTFRAGATEKRADLDDHQRYAVNK